MADQGNDSIEEEEPEEVRLESPEEEVRPEGEIESLVPGEKIIADTKPFPLAFLPFYIPGLYLLAVTVFFLFRKEEIIARIPETVRSETGLVSFYLVLGAAIVIPAVGYSFAKLNLRWVISGMAALVIALIVKHKVMGQPWSTDTETAWIAQNAELLVLALFGLCSVLSHEVYRQSHRYLVTNARIQTSAGVFRRRERTLPISKLNDVYLHQSFLGGLFGYATVVPLTASGIGMGSDFAALAGSASKKIFGLPTIGMTIVGGHSVQIPKSRTHDALFGILGAETVRESLMKVLAAREVRLNQ